ncbi:hypothetical protein MAUB_45970 [Mycolicibacterium aubagnense]|uniref:Uncharacterized protein n=1 Tax=Mycolicibacterium aubagnense TaxID=319707 RepID=A0ABN5Z159_9MYCO|nr:hypothetical protein MAUB_45970 [Mycolicibacterium aubagnense]
MSRDNGIQNQNMPAMAPTIIDAVGTTPRSRCTVGTIGAVVGFVGSADVGPVAVATMPPT